MKILHARNCSYNATDTPDGDFCDCVPVVEVPAKDYNAMLGRLTALEAAVRTSNQLFTVLHIAFKAAAEHPEAAKKSELDYWQPRTQANRIWEQIGYNDAVLQHALSGRK